MLHLLLHWRGFDGQSQPSQGDKPSRQPNSKSPFSDRGCPDLIQHVAFYEYPSEPERRTHVLLSFRQEKCRLIFSMRRISVSLPTRNNQRDPHEKLARYGPAPGASTLKTKIDSVKTAWMTQSQRSRYMKTGGILLFIVFLFYYLAPKGVHVGSGSNSVSNSNSNGVSNAEGMSHALFALLSDKADLTQFIQ